MPAKPKVSTDSLLQAYAELRNIQEVANLFSLNPGSVHERLNRLGVKTPPSHRRPWSAEEDERLRVEYNSHADKGALAALASSLSRTKPTIARRARELGLTKPNGRGRVRLSQGIWRHMDEKQARIMWERFKAQRMGIQRYCRKIGVDDQSFCKTMRRFFGDEYDHALELHTPKQSLYRIGRALEYRVRDYLREYGYFVLRSPASRSPIDLVAIRPGEVLFIQCKRDGTLKVSEWNELLTLSRSTGTHAILAASHESGRGCRFWRLLDLKDGSRRPQPMETWVPQGSSAQARFGGEQRWDR